jgi:nucleotide-binding universal stress UspA family protein
MSVIMAALDTTPVAPVVLETAIEFGRLTGNDVIALHVRSRASDDIGIVEALAARSGVPLRVVEGRARSALCDVLGAPEVLAAVIGARATVTGRRPVGRTALHVLEQIDKPVLVVPPDVVSPVTFRRLLVPLEGDEESSRQVLEQLGILLTAEVEIIVLHVFTHGTLPAMLDRPVRDLEIWGNEFLSRHFPPAATIELRQGAVARRVAEVSGEHGADLVVLSWSRNISAGRAAVVQGVLGASAVAVLLLPVKRLSE